MITLNKQQLEVLVNYQNALLKFNLTFDVKFYKNIIKKLYGKYDNFVINKGEDDDLYKYCINFKNKKEDKYSIKLYDLSIYIRYNDRHYYTAHYSKVRENLKIIEELDK